jgi:hypothetical protein
MYRSGLLITLVILPLYISGQIDFPDLFYDNNVLSSYLSHYGTAIPEEGMTQRKAKDTLIFKYNEATWDYRDHPEEKKKYFSLVKKRDEGWIWFDIINEIHSSEFSGTLPKDSSYTNNIDYYFWYQEKEKILKSADNNYRIWEFLQNYKLFLLKEDRIYELSVGYSSH